MLRKGVLGCQKPQEEDAVDFVLKLSFIWHRYKVYLVIFIFFYAMVETVAASTSREAVAQ